ncbi:MAG: MGMT family protein [Candidatus Binatia bacterium]
MKRPPRPRRTGGAPAAGSRAQPSFARAVYALVRRIPRGRVVTYGQVAALLGHPRAARAVGTALARLSGPLARAVPWQRVINAGGGISMRGSMLRPDLQRELLEKEGVRFRRDRTDLRRYRWQDGGSERRVALGVELPLRPTEPRRTRAPSARGQRVRALKRR